MPARRRSGAALRASRAAPRAAVGAVVVAGLGVLVPVAAASSSRPAGRPHVAAAHRPAPACSTVSTAQIKSVLGLSVAAPKPVVDGPVTVCTYAHGANPQVVLIRYQTGMSHQSFAAGRTQFDKHGEPTKTVGGIGNAAYSSVLGSGSLAVSTLVALKGKTELLITAPAPLARVEALARKVVTAL